MLLVRIERPRTGAAKRIVWVYGLIAHCAQRLAKFKVPDAVEFIDDLPRTSVGKIQKNQLRRSH